jgi:hypothetical protein
MFEFYSLMRIAAESMGSTSISALLDAIVSANENNLKYSGDKESNSETACIAIAIPQKICEEIFYSFYN